MILHGYKTKQTECAERRRGGKGKANEAPTVAPSCAITRTSRGGSGATVISHVAPVNGRVHPWAKFVFACT